jgi:hypothetical protein
LRVHLLISAQVAKSHFIHALLVRAGIEFSSSCGGQMVVHRGRR